MLVPARAVVLAPSLTLSRCAELIPQRSMWLPLTLRPVRPPTLAPSPMLGLLSRVSATEVVSKEQTKDLCRSAVPRAIYLQIDSTTEAHL